MADAESTRTPASDATVEPQKCCGNCRWLVRRGGSWGECTIVFPPWVDRNLRPHPVGNKYGTDCDAWQQREAE